MSVKVINVAECHVTGELLSRRNPETPDFLSLKLQKHIPIFVYDSLKVGGADFGVLDRPDVHWLGDAKTAVPGYTMYRTSNGLPMVDKTEIQHEDSGHIMGEVFAVSPKVILELDRIYGNNAMSIRTKAFVFLLDQKYKTVSGMKSPSIQVYMYMMKKDFWETLETKRMTLLGSQIGYFYEFDHIFHRQVKNSGVKTENNIFSAIAELDDGLEEIDPYEDTEEINWTEIDNRMGMPF